MSRWTWPAYVGVIGGVVVFVMFLLPIVVWQYRRYGRLSWLRLLGSAAVAVYGVALVAYTLLPLPSGDLAQWCAQHGFSGPQLNPFQFVEDIRRDTAGMSAAARLRSPAVLQTVFNVVLFVPWGVLVRRFFGWRLPLTVLSAFAASLLIETTQGTGIFGLIPCSYRLADVDDLLTNTLGGLIGALIAPVVLRWMPRSTDLATERGVPRLVTVWRRWLGMLLDAFLVSVTGTVLVLFYRVALVALGQDVPLEAGAVDVVLGSLVPVVLVLLVPPFLGSGASWGQRAMWLEPRWTADVAEGPVGAGGLGRGTMARRVVRGLASGGLWGVCLVLAEVPGGGLLPDVAAPLGSLVAFVAVVSVLFTRDRRGVSGVVSGARMVDARS
ncbi:VanZ family protein [Oerskovia rustica]|uniref:VanZ family protein n=1 Tax=Oerskovia rustica TaxID=2762237 RepID=A0ABR8RQC9_9CELL|nr:VanZ family protein [Oerskovia rustica]MBD7949985.1 VanZ family protein [Oerskovia rustica]